MSIRAGSALVLMALAATGEPSRPHRNIAGVVAHAWGTFTSVAAADGGSMNWYRIRPGDLPCFVHRIAGDGKAMLAASVRMETPVLYFYSPQPATLSVNVGFPRGLFTEWYPQATVTPNSIASLLPNDELNARLAWDHVEVLPGANAAFPREATGNHYYAARETDAAPLKVGEQFEKLLFYRGAGHFEVPYTATIDGNGVVFGGDTQSFGGAILLENRGGRIGFRPITPSGTAVPIPTAAKKPHEVTQTLERMLTQAGLYPREARAMLATWKDAWLEEGTRILYIVPKPFVDKVLPLRIAPEPVETQRVFLGRLELLPDWIGDTVRQALLDDDAVTLKKWDRFYNPIQERCREKLTGIAIGPRIKAYWQTVAPTCAR
jgi:hypothetical protein